MKHYFSSISFIALLCLFFYSCEWDNDEKNYIEIERPQSITMGIDLAGVKEDEVIYIYNDTYLYFSLSTQGKTLLQTNFYLDGNSIGGDFDRIRLSLNQLDNKEHILKVVVVAKTGSGSIADFANLEHYIGEYNFKIRFVDQGATKDRLTVKQTLDNNKYLKLTWNKPSMPISKYEVYNKTWSGDENLIATINDPNQNWYLDENYVYGFKQYIVRAFVSNSKDVYFEGLHTATYSTINEDNFKVEILGLNEAKLVFTNPNPYPFCVVVQDADNHIYEMKNVNSVLFTKPLFPIYGESLRTFLLPANYEGNNYSDFDGFNFYYSDNTLQGLPNVTTVDVTKQQLIGSNFSDFYVYDKDLKRVSSAHILYQLHSRSRISSLANGFTVIQDMSNYIHVYSNNSINNELWDLPLGLYDDFSTGKNKIAVTNYLNNTLSVYDVTTQNKIITMNYGGEPKYSRWLYSFLSYDDKYLAVFGREYSSPVGWYKIYEISGNTLIERKSEEDVAINDIIFNYNKPDEVIISYTGKFDIVDLSTMQRKQTITGSFRGIDKITGNLIYRTTGSGYQFKILNPNYTNEILSFYTNEDNDVKLFNKYLIMRDYFIHTDKIKNK